jgi:HSP20 family molecular chaperone IbpA
VPRVFASPFEEFERTLDRMFNDLLIQPWREAARLEQPAIVIDRDAEYEVRLRIEDFRPEQLQVDVSLARLAVRASRGGELAWERTFSFSEPVEVEQVSARWAHNHLTVRLPKRRRG